MDDEKGLDALHVIATTRSIRRYRPDQVPVEDLNRILWSATRAPSGSNRQPFRFLVLRESESAKAAKSLLGRAFRRGWEVKRETDGFGAGTGLDRSSPKSRQAAAMQDFVDNFESIPVVILVCLKRYREPNPYEGASVYPACQNLLLAARSLGYGGALTMWHQMVENELREILDVPEDVALSACITLGKPKGAHGPVRRRPIGELVFENRWDESASWVSDPPGTTFTSAGPPR